MPEVVDREGIPSITDGWLKAVLKWFESGLEKTRVFLKKTQPSGFFGFFLGGGFCFFFFIYLPSVPRTSPSPH
jgi:hypothetical protein